MLSWKEPVKTRVNMATVGWIIGISHAPSFVINFFQFFLNYYSGQAFYPDYLSPSEHQKWLLLHWGLGLGFLWRFHRVRGSFLFSHKKRFVWISHCLLTEGSLELQPLGTLNDLIYSPAVKRLAFPLSLCARTKTQDVWRPHGLQMSYWAAFTHIVVWLNSVLADESFPELIISPLDSLQKEQIMQIRTF